jgi:hypothetical protein
MLSRRTFVSLAAASAAAPRLAAGQPAPREAAPSAQGAAATSFYQKGNVRIRYQDVGSGFPLLVTPGGGLNSCIAKWPTAVFNAPEEFKSDFRCITMDQRNATDGESTGPIPVDDPWGRLRRRPTRTDGPPRHPEVFLYGLLHRRPVRLEADAAGP